MAPSLFGEEAARRKLPVRVGSPTVRDADTVVVATTHAYPEFERFGAYVCEPKRSFRENIEYLGFYAERHIQPVFPSLGRAAAGCPLQQGTGGEPRVRR